MRLSTRSSVLWWIGVTLLLCAIAPDAFAGGPQTSVPDTCGAAATVGLALMAALKGGEQ